MLFDSHAHYNDERFKDDVDEVLSAMNENNVGLILNSCSSLDEVPDIFAICEKYPFVYASVGIHPHEVSELTEADMDKLKEYAKNPKVKAIGDLTIFMIFHRVIFSKSGLQDKWTLHESLKCRLLYTTEKRIRIVWIFCVNIR